jgi:hypothetical protein
MNLGNGKFCDASKRAGNAIQEPNVSRGAAFGDLDNDGDIDVVVGDLDGAPLVLQNQNKKQNHWVTFELSAKKRQSSGDRGPRNYFQRQDHTNRRDTQRRQLSFAK